MAKMIQNMAKMVQTWPKWSKTWPKNGQNRAKIDQNSPKQPKLAKVTNSIIARSLIGRCRTLFGLSAAGAKDGAEIC